MELGEKLKAARLEAGLSQRKLCGDTITRNMLSQIENGSARPSMDTLAFLAAGLGKSVSYFLEEEAVTSPNQAVMETARQQWARGDAAGALESLEGFRMPDPVFQSEQGLLRFLCLLAVAGRALEEGRVPYALELLRRAELTDSPYITAALERQRRLLLAKAGEKPELPGEDEALLLRAGLAEDPLRRLELLQAAEDKSTAQWCLLAGQAYYSLEAFEQAARYLSQAEEACPRETAPLLEVCYRELQDYRKAYEYACRVREYASRGL